MSKNTISVIEDIDFSDIDAVLAFHKENISQKWGFPADATMLADGDDDDDDNDDDSDVDEDDEDDEEPKPKPKKPVKPVAKPKPKPKAKPVVDEDDDSDLDDEDEDDEPKTPAQKTYTPGYVKSIKSKIIAARTERDAIRTEFAVYKAAVKAGADADELLDSSKFKAAISEVDINDSEAVADLIKTTVESNPKRYGLGTTTPSRNPRPGSKTVTETPEDRNPRSRMAGAYEKTSTRRQ